MPTIRLCAAGLIFAVVLAVSGTGSPVDAAGASLKILPETLSVAKGQSFEITVAHDAAVATSGAQVSIDFDPAILQVTSVALGSAYATAPIVAPRDIAADISSANVTGHLAQIAAAFTPPDFVPPGPADFLVVRFSSKGCGQTSLRLPVGPFDGQMISGAAGVYGTEVPVTTADGHVTTCAGSGVVAAGAPVPAIDGTSASLATEGVLATAGLLVASLLGALLWRSRRRRLQDDPI